jgi:hypothetical protein
LTMADKNAALMAIGIGAGLAVGAGVGAAV